MVLVVKVGDDWFDLVAEEVFLALVDNELDTKGLAQITHQRGFIMYRLETGKFLLLAWQLMVEPHLCNLLNLIIDLSRRDANKTRWNQPVKTTGKNWLREEILYLELFAFPRILHLSEENVGHFGSFARRS